MSTIPLNLYFATAIGIHSLAGAIVLTVLYVPLLAIFFCQIFHPSDLRPLRLNSLLSKCIYKECIFQQSLLP